MNGQRLQPQPSRKEKIRQQGTEIQNLQMALRIQQMMTQQLVQSNNNMKQDLGSALNLVNELQYKFLAIQKASGLDVAKLTTIADELRLKDFNEASDKENIELGFTPGTLVDENSTVIITSTTDTPEDKGIFRSKLKLSECGSQDLIDAFMGRELGAKAIVKLNGVDHTIEILSILQPPTQAETSETQVEATH